MSKPRHTQQAAKYSCWESSVCPWHSVAYTKWPTPRISLKVAHQKSGDGGWAHLRDSRSLIFVRLLLFFLLWSFLFLWLFVFVLLLLLRDGTQ